MRVKCLHGFYIFTPETVTDRAFFGAETGHKLVKSVYGWTFTGLAALLTFALKGQPYGGQTATVNYCGYPWDIMQANGWVYDIQKGALLRLSEISATFTPSKQATGEGVVFGLPQAGAKGADGVLINFECAFRFYGQKVIIYEHETI